MHKNCVINFLTGTVSQVGTAPQCGGVCLSVCVFPSVCVYVCVGVCDFICGKTTSATVTEPACVSVCQRRRGATLRVSQ